MNITEIESHEIARMNRITLEGWGHWRYNQDHSLKFYKGDKQYYAIDLNRCNTSAEILDWIYQIKHMTWAEKEDISNLVYAFDDIFNTVQANICSRGVDHAFNATEYLDKVLDHLFFNCGCG